MNKRKSIIIVVVILVALAIAIGYFFNKNNISTSLSNYNKLEKRDDLYIEIKKDSITNISLEYFIYNKTTKAISFGPEYKIEVYKNNKWKQFNIQVTWNNPGYSIESNSYKKMEINFKEIYGKLSKGKYRIIKEINNIVLFDEFEI